MATFKFEGLNEYVAELERLSAHTEDIIGKAVYEGADVVADAINEAIGTIPIDDEWHKEGEMRNGLRSIEVAGLKHGFGIARMRHDGDFTNVKVGFHDLNRLGKPNIGVARSIESGTSYMRKYPFIRKATTQSKPLCEKRMQTVLEEEIKKLVK